MQYINGDELLFIGTRKECAKHFNVSVETVTFWRTPSNFKRIEEAGKHNRKLAIRI
jgi:hypothetical protein